MSGCSGRGAFARAVLGSSVGMWLGGCADPPVVEQTAPDAIEGRSEDRGLADNPVNAPVDLEESESNGEQPDEPSEQGSVCGNGVVEADEICDDGGTSDGDGCSSFLHATPYRSLRVVP